MTKLVLLICLLLTNCISKDRWQYVSHTGSVYDQADK
jgi:hypothetical protein